MNNRKLNTEDEALLEQMYRYFDMDEIEAIRENARRKRMRKVLIEKLEDLFAREELD